MKFADCFFIFMLFVFTLLLILAGVLSFLLGSPSLLAAFGIFAGFGLCIGVFVGCCLSGRMKEHHRWENARRRAADPLIKILRMNSRRYDRDSGS